MDVNFYFGSNHEWQASLLVGYHYLSVGWLHVPQLPRIEPTRGSLRAKRLFIHACFIGAGIYIYVQYRSPIPNQDPINNL